MYFQSNILQVIGSAILYGFILEQTIFSIPQFPAITYWLIQYGCFYYIAILDWIGLDRIGSNWIGSDWIRLDQIGLDWIGLDWIGLERIGSDQIRLDQIG